MQLNVTTDYAIRTVLLLAMKGEPATSQEISSTMKIPQDYVITMMKRLKEQGLVESLRGTSGGYRLLKEPWDISLLEIIKTMEGTTKINRCLEGDHYCSRKAADTCPVRAHYEKLQRLFDDSLSSITIDCLI